MKYEIMLKILFELLSKKSVTAKYLADKFEVSRRSIYRYIESIEFAGVPIYSVSGNGGGFAVMDTYRLSSTFMTIEEFEQAIKALCAVNDGISNKVLDSAITKLKATVKKEYSGFDIKSGNLIIDGGPWGDSIGYKNKIGIIQKCIDENLQLSIRYHDRNGEVSERVIDPHILVFKQGLWYVYAFCNLRNTFRFFKTGRIECANILKSKFVRKEIDSNSLPFDFWHTSVEAVDIEMQIDKACLSDAEEWLGVENIYLENGNAIARVKLPFDDGLTSKIMSFGSGIKVISPQNLKEKIKQIAKEITLIY